MNRLITASMLYNLSQCPHRLFLDVHGDPGKKDPESSFLRLLWEKGTEYEKGVVEGLNMPFVDLSARPHEVRERLTLEAMDRGEGLIYSGRIRSGDLLGEPDLLLRKENGYVAADIKSSSGLKEGTGDPSGGRLKRHYAIQLSLYTDILEGLGLSGGRHPFIWDIHGRKITYNLDMPSGSGSDATLWQLYRMKLDLARRIVSMEEKTLPAYSSSTCKLCHWNSLCKDMLSLWDDLTLIPELGRARRDAMHPRIKTISEFARADLADLIRGQKSVFAGINPGSLRKFHMRARLLADPQARPIIKKKPHFPDHDSELFFDIETDPMRDICYLHGFLERKGRDNSTTRYRAFLAQTPDEEGERQAFAQAWAYVLNSMPCAIYFYSKYEQNWWRKLQKRHPGIATEQQIRDMFNPHSALDLYYGVVVPCTEWPTTDHSIKTLANYLGFRWRDESPSGADSIEWYHRWTLMGDESVKQRILAYNEDDCIATMVVLDGIRGLCGKRQELLPCP